MTDNEAYRATIARLERDLAKAESVAAKLRTGIAAIRDIIDADAISAPSAEGQREVFDTAQTFRLPSGMTMKEAALAVLRRKREPMKIREIYNAMQDAGFNHTKGYESFRGSLTPTLDRSAEFIKSAPGYYWIAGLPLANKTAPSAGSTQGRLLELESA